MPRMVMFSYADSRFSFVTAHPDPVEQSKADTVKAALQAVGGPWVFLDHLNGGWVNSAGASAPQTGLWQTGTGSSLNSQQPAFSAYLRAAPRT